MPEPLFKNDVELIHFFSEKLRFSWERYLTVIHLMISMSGGSILVYLNGLFIGERTIPWTNMWLIITALVLAFGALLAALVWRFASQFFMDREIFGSGEFSERYFNLCGIRSVTDYHELYYETKMEFFYRWVFKVTRWMAPISMIISWVVAIFFIMLNLPDTV